MVKNRILDMDSTGMNRKQRDMDNNQRGMNSNKRMV